MLRRSRLHRPRQGDVGETLVDAEDMFEALALSVKQRVQYDGSHFGERGAWGKRCNGCGLRLGHHGMVSQYRRSTQR